MEVDVQPQQQQQQQHNVTAVAGTSVEDLCVAPQQQQHPALASDTDQHVEDSDGIQPHKKQRRPEPTETQQQQQQLTDTQAVAAAAAQLDGRAREESAAAQQLPGAAATGAADIDMAEADTGSGGGIAAAVKRFAATDEQLDSIMAEGGFTSCIIAAPRLHTISVIQEILPLLAPSTPFVVFR
jgi:hypothetical protein